VAKPTKVPTLIEIQNHEFMTVCNYFSIASDTYNRNGCSCKQVANNKQSQVVNDVFHNQIHIPPPYVHISQSLL
jgi:hypothetical protein